MIQKIYELHENGDLSGRVTYWIFECPACLIAHGLKNDGRWSFNGSIYAPTFTPSLVVSWEETVAGNVIRHRCHSFITDGMIHYQGDCTHIFAGQVVELLSID